MVLLERFTAQLIPCTEFMNEMDVWSATRKSDLLRCQLAALLEVGRKRDRTDTDPADLLGRSFWHACRSIRYTVDD